MELLLCGLWGVCFVRAWHFYSEARVAFALYGSGDAFTDFSFSQQILICYGVSFVVGVVLVWWACFWRNPLFWVLAGGAYAVAAVVVFARPESVVVLLPDLTPYMALLGSVGLVVVAGIGGMVTRRGRS